VKVALGGLQNVSRSVNEVAANSKIWSHTGFIFLILVPRSLLLCPFHGLQAFTCIVLNDSTGWSTKFRAGLVTHLSFFRKLCHELRHTIVLQTQLNGLHIAKLERSIFARLLARLK